MTIPRDEGDILNVLLRNDLRSFIHWSFQAVVSGGTFRPNWHIQAIAWHLTKCLDGRIRRLIITLPPRSLKSICASVAFPAWVLGRDPTRKIICASYSQELAAKHARDCRALMQSERYRKVFSKTRIDPEKNSELEFMTTARGFRLTTSVGGTLTGRGGNFILIDDPLKPSDAVSRPLREAVNQWYSNTLYSRLDDKSQDVIVIIMQRLHLDDLVGHVLEGEDWTHLNLPAIAVAPEKIFFGEEDFHERQPGDLLHPERESKESLDRIRTTMGTYGFSAQYQQNPIPPEGNLIKWGWFNFFSTPPDRESNDQIVQSWDTASKADELNDYSVCTTWLLRGKDCYLLDVTRRHADYPALKKLTLRLVETYRADAVLIEDRSSGTQLIQDLNHEGEVRPIAIQPEGDKVTRMSTQSAKIEAGHVFLPEQAPWLEEFQSEVLQFPHGRYDDQIDSLSQFLKWVSQHDILPTDIEFPDFWQPSQWKFYNE